jgi:hypothetical protein
MWTICADVWRIATEEDRMKVTELAKHVLRVRRDNRDMIADGWEHIGEFGGKLWELYRGERVGHAITDVRIAADGISLWIKTKQSE